MGYIDPGKVLIYKFAQSKLKTNPMKNLKLILVAVVLSASSLFTTSCNNGAEKDKNPLADSLSGVNGELNGQLSEKEAALQEFVTSFNEIQENLNAIKEKEKIVSKSAASGDVKNKEAQIKEDIQAIYDLLAKNRNKIGSLSKKLKDSNSKIAGLDEMIANLQSQIDAKDAEVADLKTQLEAKNIELSNIQMNLETVEAESASKTSMLNTAYFAIGTSKELKEKNVITKEGGFIGIGKSTKVKGDFNKEYFTKIDITQTNSIAIGSKRAKLLTSHPGTSYRMVGEKPVEKIEITNPSEFWSTSKYLIIITD